MSRLRLHNLATRGRSAALVALIALLASSGVALAQASSSTVDAPGGPGTVQRTQVEADEMALDLAVKFMSPFCPGASLRDCTSGKAADLRNEIKAWLREGATIGWIEDQLVARHGESILGAPRFRGFNTLVWIFPVLAVIVGLGMILAYLQRQHAMSLAKVPAAEVDTSYQADPELEKRLEEELSRRSG